VTSIRERAVFTVTGEMNELDVKEPPAYNALSKGRVCAILWAAGFPDCLFRQTQSYAVTRTAGRKGS
jgi:hypothetical protein